MKNLACCVGILLTFTACSSGNSTNSAVGPTSVGSISIGMSKAEYLSAIAITPVDCSLTDQDGKANRAEMKYLEPGRKALCRNFFKFKETGSTENIHVGGISYDVIEANYVTSKIVKSIGNSSKAIFLNDSLISIEIYDPEVSPETLITKYGPPNIVDNTNIETCQNSIGGKFENKVGTIDAVWTNGDVNAILRTELKPPSKTCSDGLDLRYYLIEDRKQLAFIEAAINSFIKDVDKTDAKSSQF
jgi:hypothetical protein